MSKTLASAATVPAPASYRVMLVDDSAVIRGLMTRWLESAPGCSVVAWASNGLAAVQQVKQARPDVLVLDIEMPQMDGLTALPQLIAACPGVKIIVASTLTKRNAEISLRALTLGATDYLAKPTSMREGGKVGDFQIGRAHV